MADDDLMAQFTAIDSPDVLFSRVIALGRSHGIDISPAELESIARDNRRAWLERWLPA